MNLATSYVETPRWQVRLEEVPCPRCGYSKSSTVYEARDYIYGLPGEYFAAECEGCGLWFQNPRPADDDLASLYPDSYAPHQSIDGKEDSSTEVDQGAFVPATANMFKQGEEGQTLFRKVTQPLRKQEWLKSFLRGWNGGHIVRGLGYAQKKDQGKAENLGNTLGAVFSSSARWRAGCDLLPHYIARGKVLEIGCGNGSGLERLRELGWEDLHGVELSATAASHAAKLGFDVRTGTVESALEAYPDNSFDAIVSAMVLEHLVNPFEVVRQIARKLKPGGEFLFSTVIRDSLDGRVFGRYGVSYDVPRHMVFFRKRDLDEMLRSRFQEVKSWHQSTPIDFQRPAYLRGQRFDSSIRRFFGSALGARLVRLLARPKLMGRVSYRCRLRSQ
jgi:2-polyprenyl-3-methyl-5-hydroxy-6-metoxy-1,4-benzoquinol methylase